MQRSGEWFTVQVSNYMREIDRNHKGLVLFVPTTDWISVTNYNYIFMIRRCVTLWWKEYNFGFYYVFETKGACLLVGTKHTPNNLLSLIKQAHFSWMLFLCI